MPSRSHAEMTAKTKSQHCLLLKHPHNNPTARRINTFEQVFHKSMDISVRDHFISQGTDHLKVLSKGLKSLHLTSSTSNFEKGHLAANPVYHQSEKVIIDCERKWPSARQSPRGLLLLSVFCAFCEERAGHISELTSHTRTNIPCRKYPRLDG